MREPLDQRWQGHELVVVRLAASATSAAGAGVVVLELAAGRTDAVLPVAAVATLASAAVAVGAHVRRWYRLIASYPLLLSLAALSLVTTVPPPSIVSLGTLLGVLFAALVSGRGIGLATVAAHALAETGGWLLTRGDASWTFASIVVGAVLYGVTRTTVEGQRAAVADAQQVARTREDFVATVSHELRTPVHVVAGMIETLVTNGDQLTPAVRDELGSRLVTRGAELRGLLDGLLDFSRLANDRLRVDLEPVDLADVCILSVERLRGHHPDHEITLEVGQDAVVQADPFLLPRVVDNLVGNACTHTPPGSKVLVVVRRAGTHVEVSVRDDGPGIAADELPHLLQRFYRGGDHLRRPTGGLGLGLAYCSEVLDRHGAALEVRSTQGDGATFSFRLRATADAPGRRVPPARARVAVDD